jgi:rhodanese-related sulfurtransferase
MTQQVTFLEPAEIQVKLKDDTAYVIDVREPIEYAEVRFAGLSLMLLSQFDPSSISPLENKTLIFHCRIGQRCGLALEQLIVAGYKGEIYRMVGGLLAWAATGLPVETGEST